jgi:L-fuconolactonase
MRIDSHQHFWIYSSEQYPWMTDRLAVLRQDKLPADIAPLLRPHRIEGTVAVQARQSLEESRWLLDLARQNPIIKGVVGWVDLRSSEVHRQLEELAAFPKFVGVRHVAQDEPDDQFLARPEFVRGVALLKDFGLTYDLLIFPKQLPAAIELVQRLPEQPFVLDHIAKPSIREGLLEPWANQIRELAKGSNVYCKISGMITEADWNNWKKDDFRRYLDVILESFGPERLMYGSDWPVCLLAGSYDDVFELALACLKELSAAEQERVFGENAAAFYGLPRRERDFTAATD